MGIGEEMQFWGDTAASVGPSGCEGPRGLSGGGVQVWHKEAGAGKGRKQPMGMVRSIGRSQPRTGMGKSPPPQTSSGAGVIME